MRRRLSGEATREHHDVRRRCVALDDCRYDGRTVQPIEGSVVDSDEDLVELCARIQDSAMSHCAIVFCGEEDEPVSRRTH